MRILTTGVPWIALAVAAIGAIDASPLHAQWGGYPAYGAWRGRARTVIRGNVMRSHVRWGGGITPQAVTMFTSPEFWTGVGGLVGTIGGLRSDELAYVTAEELDAIRAQRRADRAAEAQRQAAFRSDSNQAIREILKEHGEIIDRLKNEPVSGGSRLEGRTRQYLSDAREILESKGQSAKLPEVRATGATLEKEYDELRQAIQATNSAIEGLRNATVEH